MVKFDRFIFVDWSSSKGSNTGENSIWIGSCSRGAVSALKSVNPPTRKKALSYLKEMITSNGNRKTLVGFDFGFGYPHKAYDVKGIGKDWKDLWNNLYNDLYDKDCKKEYPYPHYELANRWNEKYKLCFWGSHEGVKDIAPNVKPKKDEASVRMEGKEGIKEFRITEERVKWSGVKSQWQLFSGVTVGSQTLLGIPYAYELKEYLKKNNIETKVWPFETEFGKKLDDDFDVLMCEVHFGAIVRVGEMVDERKGEVRDKVQVEEMCRFFAEEDKDGSMLQKFLEVDCDCVSPCQKKIAQEKEGWILGVPLCLQPCDRPHKK